MTERVDEVHPLPPAVLIRLVNEWGDVARVAAGESSSPYPASATLLDLTQEPWRGIGPLDQSALTDVANDIHPLFASDSARHRAELLDHLIRVTAMRPAFAADGWSVRAIWRTDHGDRRLLASATYTVIEQLRHDPDARRMGTCHGNACADAYIDQSPAGRRQFCSLTCQNRHRARVYRARRDTGPR